METWVEAAAARFWREAGEDEPFPRSLEGSVSLALPVALEKISCLRVSSTGRWLRDRAKRMTWHGISERPVEDRPLRGCLLAIAGQGCIFVDANDPPDEQRFTVAHEAAHFMLDYRSPRERTSRRLGATLLNVLDGERTATNSERVDAALADVDIRPYAHLFERGPFGVYDARVLESETRADILALELLAPEALALGLVPSHGPLRHRVSDGAAALQGFFGLPSAHAERYARRLLGQRGDSDRWGDWLGTGGR